jgi:hypothetical protein
MRRYLNNELWQTPAALRRAEEFLAPIINGTSKYGDKKRIADQLSEIIGEPVPRNTIEKWLHSEASQRRQPHLGIALLLREVFEANKNKQNRKEKNRNGKTRQTKQSRSGGASKAN